MPPTMMPIVTPTFSRRRLGPSHRPQTRFQAYIPGRRAGAPAIMLEDEFEVEHGNGSEHHTQCTAELGGEGSSRLGRDSAVDADLASLGTHEPGGDGLAMLAKKKAPGGGSRSNPSTMKAEAKKRGCKTTKQGKVQCRGCRRYFPGEIYGVNNVFCPQDKKALDRIKVIAEAQGPHAVKFYREARQDPDRVYNMLQNYFKSCPPPPPGQRASKTGPKWDMVQYIEQVKCQSGTISDSVGVMMWRGQYIDFCKSAAGGHKAEAQAETEWNNLVEQWERDKDAFVWDNKSPNQRYPLRLRIVEKDLSIMRNAYMHEKILSMQAKGQKRASDEDLEKLRLKTMQDHDFAQQQGGGAFNMQDMARRMMRNAGENANAFVAKDVQIEDITALIPEDEDEDEDEDLQESEAVSASAASASKTPSKSSNQDGWWNRDVNINNARRSLKKSLELTRMNLGKTLGELSKTIEAVEALGEAHKAQFTHEITSGRSRLHVLTLVLGDDGDALKEAIHSFQPRMGEARRNVAPPCRTYADLVLLTSIEAELKRYDIVNTKEEMDMIPKECGLKKRPLLDLERSCKEAMASIVKAQGDVRSLDASKARFQDNADSSIKKRGRPARQSTKNICEHGLSYGTEVTCCSTEADLAALAATLDRSKPMLISAAASHAAVKIKEPKFEKLRGTLSQLNTDLEAQKLCVGGSTRGQKPLGGDEKALAEELIKSCVPHDSWCLRLPDGLEKADVLQRAMGVCAFGLMAKCEPWSCAEKCHLGCVRFSFTGTRLMVMTPEASMFSFLGLRNPGVRVSFNDLWQYFRSMDDALLQLYTEKNAPGLGLVW